MPRAAAVAADFVLPPGGIAERLVSIARQDGSEERGQPRQPAAAAFDRVLQLLRAHHPVDFSHFKRASLERRILRRVLLGNHDGLSSYADSLEKDSAAVETLYQDLLIGVTSFFREPARFEALKTVVFPAIVQNRGAEDSVRHLGGGLLDRRGGVLAGHHAARVPRRPSRCAADLHLRDRHQ